MMASESSITLDATVRRHRELMSTEVDGEAVLMSIETGKYYGLDAVATGLWRRLEDPIRVGELVKHLQADFEGDPEIIERDARAFLARLAVDDLIEVS